MDGDLVFMFGAIMVAVASLVGGLMYHEHLWMTEASDYQICSAACRNGFSSSGTDPDVKLDCFKSCLPLSEDFNGAVVINMPFEE